MKIKALLGMALLLAVLTGCGSDDEKNEEPVVEPREFALTDFTNTGCKSAQTRGFSPKEHFELTSTKDGRLYVKHTDVYFNCASRKFKAEASLEGQTIKVMELDATHAEMMATCECPFDLGYVIGPLQEGVTYTMTITTTTETTPELEAMGVRFDKTETTITFTYSSEFSDVFPVRYEGEAEIYGKWELEYYTKDGDFICLDYPCGIEFSKDGSVEVNAINQIMGKFTLLEDKRQISFSKEGSTKVGVINEGVQFFEDYILTSTYYLALYDELMLYYTDDDYFMFTKKK
jgi:hypothetical protein